MIRSGNLLTMRVHGLDRLAFGWPHRATSSSGDNVKVCRHGLLTLLPGRSCAHLADEDVIGDGGHVRAEDFGARLEGFWTQIVERLPQPRAVSKRDAIRLSSLASARWIPAQVASARWIPWIPKRIQLCQVVIPQVTDNASPLPKSRAKWLPPGFPGESACR